MNWTLLLVLGVLLVIFAIVMSSTPPTLVLGDGDVWLPGQRYYAWMIIDADLEGRPLLDTCMPLPTFRTLSEGAVQVVNLYSHDSKSPIGGKRYAATNARGNVAVGSLIQTYLLAVLDGVKDLKVIRWRQTAPYRVRVTVEVAGELHDFLVTFLPLDNTISTPRRAVKNVGFFSQPIIYQQKQIDVIQRYRRAIINWQPMPNIPREWYPQLQAAINYWNDKLLPLKGPRLVFKPEPWLGDIGDPSINLFCLARSSGYIGVGTTVIDQRSGEHLWSRVNIDLSSLQQQSYLFPTVVDRSNYLLQYAITHECGHCLGLRHNFIAQEDSNSSVMGYFPQFYPDEKGEMHFLTKDISGEYDKLAMLYGYTQIPSEDFAQVPAQLQVQIDKARHLFHTDENVDQDCILSQVHRHAMSDALTAPRRWMTAFRRYKPLLFKDPVKHLQDVQRTFYFLSSLTEAITNSVTYVEGYRTDYRREKLHIDDHTQTVISEVVEFLVGDTWRLGELENSLTSVMIDEQGQLRIMERPWEGSYTIDRAPLAAMHINTVLKVARALFIPQRVAVFKNSAQVLLQFLSTPSTLSKRTILGPQMDSLQLATLIGFLSTIEYYKPSYPTQVQGDFDHVTEQISAALKSEHRAAVVNGTVRALKLLEQGKFQRSTRGCGHRKPPPVKS